MTNCTLLSYDFQVPWLQIQSLSTFLENSGRGEAKKTGDNDTLHI